MAIPSQSAWDVWTEQKNHNTGTSKTTRNNSNTYYVL